MLEFSGAHWVFSTCVDVKLCHSSQHALRTPLAVSNPSYIHILSTCNDSAHQHNVYMVYVHGKRKSRHHAARRHPTAHALSLRTAASHATKIAEVHAHHAHLYRNAPGPSTWLQKLPSLRSCTHCSLTRQKAQSRPASARCVQANCALRRGGERLGTHLWDGVRMGRDWDKAGVCKYTPER